MAHKFVGISTTILLAAAGAPAHAQVATSIPVPLRSQYQFPSQPPESGAANVQLGDSPFYIAPYVGAGIGYDDNVLLAPDHEKASALYVVSPGFKIDARTAASVFRGGYQGQVGRYTSSHADDYVDDTSYASFDNAFGYRTFLHLGYDYVLGHDPRGSTDRGVGTTPDRYRLWGPNATLAYGAPGAQGRLEAYFSSNSRNYLNNYERTAASNRDTREYGAAFYWRAMPKTQVLVEARKTDLDYQLPGSPLSGWERRVYGGVSWEVTAQTTGTIKVGGLRKEFDSGLEGFSSTGWEGLVTWAPRTYSKFDLYTARFPTESTGLGRFVLSDAVGLMWTHAWSSVITTAATLRYQRDRYQGFDRDDNITAFGVKAGYRFRRWLTLGAEYSHMRRTSNLPEFEFDRNFYLLTATASM